MDLMDFDQATLYFDDPLPEAVESLLREAGDRYGDADGNTECLLLRAWFLAPEQLVVLVGLYRYYFYQHRLEEALTVAERALQVAGGRLGLPALWRDLHPEHVGHAVLRSMGLLRFHLMVLKAAGYLQLRLGRAAEGEAMLQKLVELDSHDRLGGKALLDVVRAEHAAAA